MKLAHEQIRELVKLSEAFKQIIREQMEKPNDFDKNINCLRKIEPITRSYMTIMAPFINHQLRQGEKLLHSRWNLVTKLSIKSELNKDKKLLEEAYSFIFDEELKNLMIEAFKGKYVTGLLVHIDDNSKIKHRYNGAFFKQESHIVTYAISFSDGTKFEWHSLEDQQQMDLARKVFVEKVPQPTQPRQQEEVIQTMDTSNSPEYLPEPVNEPPLAPYTWCGLM